MLLELAKTLGSIAILSALIAWLAKTIISHWLDKDVELYKSKITKETELFKISLQSTLYEQQVRFLKLHERRIDLFPELYEKIERFFRQVDSFIDSLADPMSDIQDDKLFILAMQALETANAALKSQLYLDDLTSKLLDRLYFAYRLEMLLEELRRNDLVQVPHEWLACIKNNQEEREDLKRQVVDRFKEILGTSSPILTR